MYISNHIFCQVSAHNGSRAYEDLPLLHVFLGFSRITHHICMSFSIMGLERLHPLLKSLTFSHRITQITRKSFRNLHYTRRSLKPLLQTHVRHLANQPNHLCNGIRWYNRPQLAELPLAATLHTEHSSSRQQQPFLYLE